MHASDGDVAHADGRRMKRQNGDKNDNHDENEDEDDDEHADDEHEEEDENDDEDEENEDDTDDEENMDDEDDMDDEENGDASCACSICSRALSRPALCSNPSTLPIFIHEVCWGGSISEVLDPGHLKKAFSSFSQEKKSKIMFRFGKNVCKGQKLSFKNIALLIIFLDCQEKDRRGRVFLLRFRSTTLSWTIRWFVDEHMIPTT